MSSRIRGGAVARTRGERIIEGAPRVAACQSSRDSRMAFAATRSRPTPRPDRSPGRSPPPRSRRRLDRARSPIPSRARREPRIAPPPWPLPVSAHPRPRGGSAPYFKRWPRPVSQRTGTDRLSVNAPALRDPSGPPHPPAFCAWPFPLPMSQAWTGAGGPIPPRSDSRRPASLHSIREPSASPPLAAVLPQREEGG